MENSLIRVNNTHTTNHSRGEAGAPSASRAFIEANTIAVSPSELRRDHIIPVFVKDNEPLISQADFLAAASEAVSDLYRGEVVLKPQVRVSHPIKGRVPEAKEKPAAQLEDWEKTLYYERMMFVIEIPSIMDEIGGNALTLRSER